MGFGSKIGFKIIVKVRFRVGSLVIVGVRLRLRLEVWDLR